MDIIELGAIGELVGGVAVIGSLLFVGIQLRTTTKTLRAQSSYEAFSKANELNQVPISDPRLATIINDFEDTGVADVDESSAAQLRYFVRSAFMQWSAQQFLHQQGILDDAYWEKSLEYARSFVGTEFGAAWWAKDKNVGTYPPEFVRLIDRRA